MSNMSYCRFQNTTNDLFDCVRNLYTLSPEDTSQNTAREREARAQIIELACQLVAELGIEDPGDGFEIQRRVEELDSEPARGDEDDEPEQGEP